MDCRSQDWSRERFAHSPTIRFLTRKWKRLLKSESCALPYGLITSSSPLRNTAILSAGARLFFHDLGVLNHGDATALGHLSFQRDGLAAVFGELIVHRLVFADD